MVRIDSFIDAVGFELLTQVFSTGGLFATFNLKPAAHDRNYFLCVRASFGEISLSEVDDLNIKHV